MQRNRKGVKASQTPVFQRLPVKDGTFITIWPASRPHTPSHSHNLPATLWNTVTNLPPTVFHVFPDLAKVAPFITVTLVFITYHKHLNGLTNFKNELLLNVVCVVHKFKKCHDISIFLKIKSRKNLLCVNFSQVSIQLIVK